MCTPAASGSQRQSCERIPVSGFCGQIERIVRSQFDKHQAICSIRPANPLIGWGEIQTFAPLPPNEFGV